MHPNPRRANALPHLCCRTGMGAAVLLADLVYNVPANVIVDSARRALTGYDVVTSMVKSWVFGTVVATVRGWEGQAQCGTS